MKIVKTKITWIVSEDTIVAYDKLQATIYPVYELTNRTPFDRMKKDIKSSQPEEYNSWVDVIGLAIKYGIRGYATRHKREWTEES